jgi:phosphoribosylformylglycinamidine synthase PurS subunit
MIGRIFVMPKPEVLDPQGKAIRQSLHQLGYADVADVRLGKFLRVRLTEKDPKVARERIEQMCQRLLANQVIEDYRIEVSEADDE